MSYIQHLGRLAIASRLKNLTDLLVRDMIGVYESRHIDFEPRWFTFVHLIYNKGPLPITQIARELGQTHPAANQVANALEKKGYCKTRRDKKDYRKRIISLTPSGEILVSELIPVWDAVEKSVQELLDESSPEFMKAISLIEEKLLARSMRERILERLKPQARDDIEIINFQNEFSADFRSLNEEWLKEFFTVEPEDERLLGNPELEVIRKGGIIVFARKLNRIIGTGALLHIDKNTCELTKMAVSPAFQGQRAGRKILKHLINEARDRNYKQIILLTSNKLYKAISLYQSEGFVLSGLGSSQPHNFKRCSIQMELNLINEQ